MSKKITGADLLNGFNSSRKDEEDKDKKITGADLLDGVNKIYQYRNTDTSSVNDDYINTFISDANSFFKGTEETYNGIGWGNASSVYDSTNKTWQDLKTRGDTINAWLYKNKSSLTEESYKSLSDSMNSIYSGASSILSGFEGAKNFYGQFETEDSYKQWQANEDWKAEIMGKEDFEEYSQKGADIKNPTYKDALGWIKIFGNHIGGDPIKNKVTFMQDENNWQSVQMGGDAELANPNLHFMKEDEVKIYNYYLGKGETEKAEEYLDSLNDTLNQRWGGQVAENMKKADLEWLMSINTGLDQWASGAKNLDNFFLGTEADPTSAMQYAGAAIREDIESDFWRGAWDLGVTISNQLPSILVGTVTGSIGGLATMGVSVAGNSYAEMRNLGYNEWQSRGYATLVTAAELGLQSVLGGISSLGGSKSLSKMAVNALDSVDNGIARVALKIGTNMLSEGVEEATQSVLEPIFKSIFTGEFEGIDWGEVAYSGILGALSAGVLEGGSTIASDVSTTKAGQQAQNAGVVDRLTKLGSTFSADSVAYKLAGKVDENTGAYTIGRLLNEVGGTLTEQNVSDIVKSLTRKGVTTKDANTIAKALEAVVEGTANLTEEQIFAIENNDVVSKTIADVIINPNSTVNQRMQGYAEAINMIKSGGKANAETPLNEAVGANAEIPSNKNENVEKTAKETEFSYNAEGKTIYKDQDVAVEGISSIKNGEVFVRLNSGEEVNAKEVSFSTADEALMYEMVADLGVSADTATFMMDTYNKGKGAVSAQSYRVDAPLAYRYGAIGYLKGLTNLELTGDQKLDLFGRGRTDAMAKVKADQARVDKAVEGAKNAQSSKKKGKVHFDKVNTKSMTARQKESVKALEVVAEALGVDIHLFESQKGENGKRIGANGWYDTKDNSIHIDIYAGASGEGTMLFTASHELTHFIREWSPAKFKTFADFLLEQYGAKGVSVDELVQRQIAKAKNNGRDISYDTAYEEVIADSCEAMLTDSNAIEKLAKLKAKDKTLWAKIKAFIKDLVAKIKAVYENFNPDSVEANYVREMVDVAEKLQALWTDALVDAGEAYSVVSAEKTLAENGIVVNSDTNSASLMSVRDVLSDEQRDKVSTALASRFDVTKEEAMDWLKAETSMASLILNPKYSQYLDYTADPNEVAIKQNSDYPQGTVDFSPICAKRREFTSVMNNILRLFPNHVFAATDLAKIRSIMQEEGMTIPCGICYVEDRRQLDTIVAQNFIDSLKLYREGSKTRPDGNAFNTNQLKGLKLTDGDTYTPSVYELVSLEGLNVLREKNPNMAEAWVKFNNARGMQSVRLLANEAEYKRQILKYSKSTVKSKNDKGGLRVYSFSDAEMFHLIDIIQVITDSATVGLSLQGYTKVNEYAKTVKDTGEKLNRSLIPKGELGYHLENGKVVLDYDTVEGIDINHPDFFDNRDNPNIGNITIGVSDVQIRAAMVSDFVDQIIPFHTGQSEEVLGEKGISTWSNYKDFQTEKDIATGKVSDHQINIYTEVLQVLEEEGTPITKRTFVEKFLQVCRENNLTPRFSQFLNTNENGEYVYTEGYHKMLVDFKTFAQTEGGEYLPQRPVKPIFDNEYITKILKDYVKSQKVKDAELSKSMPKVIERITNEIVKPSDTKHSGRNYSERSYESNEFIKSVNAVLEDIRVNGRWTKNYIKELYEKSPKYDFIQRIHDGDAEAITELKALVATIGDATLLDGLLYYPVYARMPDYRQSHRKAINAYKKVIKTHIAEVINGKDIGFKERDYTLAEIRDLFNSLNSNSDVAKLADKVFGLSERLDLEIAGVTKLSGSTVGTSWRNQIEYLVSYMNNTTISDQVKATLLLHELIHACTTYAINAVNFENSPTYIDVYVSSGMRKAVNTLNGIYDEIRLDKSFEPYYGITTVKEMVAELSNPIFREQLHKKNLWEMIVDAIKRIFGIETKTALDGVSVAVDYILDNFDAEAYNAHIGKQNVSPDNAVRYSDRDLAPTFYSQMGKVVEGMKQDKFAASSVISMLRGRGVKAEEIRWSGIATWLEGKKSVTKQELLEFIGNSQLQIGEQMSNLKWVLVLDGEDWVVQDKGTGEILTRWEHTDDGEGMEGWYNEDWGEIVTSTDDMMEYAKEDYGDDNTRWDQYKLDGGRNYREIVFTMPNSSYSNRAMKAHWGQDAEGVLVHARIQDFVVNGKKMLFIEELQSDWHNEGHSKGYSTKEYEDAVESHDKLYNEYKKMDLAFHKYVRSNDFRTDPEDVRKKKHDWLRGKVETAEKKYRDAEKVVNALKEKGAGDTEDAPFKDTYHEFVLKRLLRMAAEQGYDSIGWTPAEIQVKRWSEEYAEGYRIEYDQDMPKFMKKYGRQWGAKVEHSYLKNNATDDSKYIADIQAEIEADRLELEEMPDADTNEFAEFLREGIAEKQETLERLKGTKVWSMDLTDSMKDSVLHEGQVLYSDRVTDKKTLEFLENQDHVTVYRAMQVIDGKLYPPMNAYTYDKDGKKVLVTPSEIGAWEQSVERPDLIDSKTGKFKLDKGKVDGGKKGTVVPAAYNPYIHTSLSMLNDQFTSAYTRSNLVVVKGVVPKSELTSGYKAQYAKDSVGETEWHSGVVSTQLPESRKVILSRWFKPVEIMDNDVVAQNIKKMLGNTGIEIPYNVVSPKLRRSLEKIGVPIGEGRGIRNLPSKNDVKYSDRDSDSVSNRSLLANALETAAQNDIERDKLAQYKEKIALIEAEERRLSEIREQLFGGGEVDYKTRKELQFEMKQTSNRINTYDRQLLTLESTSALKKVLEREKRMAYKRAEQKGREALAAYREKTAKTTRELMNRYQESRAKATEGRHKTEYRNKIKKVVGDLNQLLLRPTKDKHVKEGLKNAVAEALSAINMDTIGADERVAKYNDLIAKTNDPDMIAELTKTRDRIELQGEALKDKLTALQTAYEKIKNSTDPELKNAYQEPVMNAIKNVVDVVGNTSIRDMNLTQLEAVYEMYKMILHTVRTANKAFKAKKGETITQISEAVNDEIRKVGKEKFTRNPIIAALRKTGWTLLKPFTAFRTIGSDTFTGLYTELRNGEDTYYVDINEAKDFIQAQYKKHNFKSWDQKQTKTFTAKSGKTFTLTLEQMMSLYAYSRRNQAHDHIIEGGIVLEDSVIKTKNKLGLPVKYMVDTKSAFNISDETLQEICDSLTAEQKGFVEDMQAYLSDVMGAKGNEVSMELLGVMLFKEKFYFPLKSSKYYMGFKPEEAGEIKLKNPAFSKETVQHANNPVVLKGFTDVWATHINDMSMYHAFVLPLEDFTRVYNYKTKTDANVETMSTEATIANAFGEGATQYIRNFLRSLNGGVRTESVRIADKAVSLSKKGAVLGSASVMIQQPSAIMRAMAHINPIHFVASTHKSINLLKHNKDWAELKQYASIAGIKEMGRFDVGMGQTTVKWIKDQNTLLEKADEILSKAPAFMDEVTWVGIWNAVKNEVKYQNKDLAVGSEAYLKKCGERFTEVVSLTQVYDSVFSRSDIMRNQSWIAKALTAFMAEPSTTLNMLVDSFIQGKRTGKVGGFVKTTAGTTGAIVGSIVLNAALKSIITAMRDDDDDESYAEKYLGAFVGNAMDDINPLGYIPFVKDIVSIFKGYDVERMDMALFSDLKNAIDAFDSDSKTEYEKWSGLVGAVSAFLGIPFKNVERDIRGAYNTIKSFIEGEQTTGAGIKEAIQEALTGEKTSNAQQLYEAIISGDQAQLDRIKGRYEDQDDIDTAIRKALRENDSRIREAAQARVDGDIAEYTRIAREIIAEGHFSQDLVVGAINAEINAIKREEAEEEGTTEDSSEAEEDEATSIYKASDINIAFDNGDTALAKEIIQDLIDTKVANGMDEKNAKSSVRSSMTSYWKPLYKEAYENGDTSEMYRIRIILRDSGLYGSTNDVIKTVQNWLKD